MLLQIATDNINILFLLSLYPTNRTDFHSRQARTKFGNGPKIVLKLIFLCLFQKSEMFQIIPKKYLLTQLFLNFLHLHCFP